MNQLKNSKIIGITKLIMITNSSIKNPKNQIIKMQSSSKILKKTEEIQPPNNHKTQENKKEEFNSVSTTCASFLEDDCFFPLDFVCDAGEGFNHQTLKDSYDLFLNEKENKSVSLIQVSFVKSCFSLVNNFLKGNVL